jgi:hypothetical protein
MIAENTEFTGRTINLDGGSFHSCQFKGCTMVFNGQMHVVMESCSFDGDCIWQFRGPAQNTIAFMRMLHAGGMAELIENVMDSIRGRTPRTGPTLQ